MTTYPQPVVNIRDGKVLPFPHWLKKRWETIILHDLAGLKDGPQRRMCHKIVKYSLRNGGRWKLSQIEFARIVGIRERMLRYHLNYLERAGFVTTCRAFQGKLSYQPGPRLYRAVTERKR